MFRALVVIAAILTATVACAAPNDGARQRGIVADGYAQARGGVRLALPVQVPDGYRLTRFWSVANGYSESGTPFSLARSAEFSGPNGTVRVCEERADVPGRLCPASNVGITERGQGLVRTVSMSAPEPADPRAVWGEVSYSSAISDWTWLTVS